MSLRLDDTISANSALIAKLPDFENALSKVYSCVSLSFVLEDCWNCTRIGDEVSMARPRTATGLLIRYFDGMSYKEIGTNNLTDIERLVSELCSSGKGNKETSSPLDDVREFNYSCQEKHANRSIADKVDLLASLADRSSQRPNVSLTKISYKEEDRLHIFLGDGRFYKQRIPFTTLALNIFVTANGRTESQKTGARLPGGLEIVQDVCRDDKIDLAAKRALDLTRVEPLSAGQYCLVASPEPASVIAHEAFGHGVEADMALRDLSKAAKFMGSKVGSELVNLYDSPQAGPTSGFYYFDDEGHVSQPTTLIEKGILTGLLSDAISAKSLKIRCSGNGRRVDYTRPVCSRMSCTFFGNGPHNENELIASVEHGLYLTGGSSGQEDPLGWGMQVNVPLAYEIKKGKLTGRVFGPVVLTGYVPDILNSIDGVAQDLSYRGLGKCGKTFWKDWVNVGMGSPTIRLSGRLA